MEIKVTSCRDCVFLMEEDEQKVCGLIPYYVSEWIDEMGFDEMFHEHIHPKSCPLLQGIIEVKLNK